MHLGAGKCLLRARKFRYSIPTQILYDLRSMPTRSSREYKWQCVTRSEKKCKFQGLIWFCPSVWSKIAHTPAFLTQFTSMFSFFTFQLLFIKCVSSLVNICPWVLINSFALQASDFWAMKWQFTTRQLCLNSTFSGCRKSTGAASFRAQHRSPTLFLAKKCLLFPHFWQEPGWEILVNGFNNLCLMWWH